GLFALRNIDRALEIQLDTLFDDIQQCAEAQIKQVHSLEPLLYFCGHVVAEFGDVVGVQRCKLQRQLGQAGEIKTAIENAIGLEFVGLQVGGQLRCLRAEIGDQVWS